MALSEQAKGYMATIGATLIIGFSFLFVKIALTYANPLDILTHRFMIALVVILPFAVWKRKELKVVKSDILPLLLMASLYPVLMFGFQIWGLSYTTSAEAGMIQAIQPLLTMVIAVAILKERISIRQKLFALLSVLGVIFIFVMQGMSQISELSGYLLLLLSCAALALYVVLSRKYKERFSVFKLTFFCIAFGTLFFILLSAGNHLLFAKQSTRFFTPFLSAGYVGSILYLGILSSLVTLVFTNYSYARVEASRLGMFGNLVPVVAIFAGVSIMGDRVSWEQVAGTVLILIGVIGVNLVKSKK